MIVRDKAALSVIIVNYLSETVLKLCLSAIDSDPLPVEAIVVDNGSSGEARAGILQRFHSLRWIEMRNNAGFGKACNAGARLASTAKLLFLNPDTRLLPGSLSHLDRLLDTPEHSNAILGCAVYDEDGGIQLSCRRFPAWGAAIANRYSLITRLFPGNALSRTYLMTDKVHDRPSVVDWVSGAAMAMRASVFNRLNGFDEYYFLYCEDVDLCKRAIQSGILTRYCHEVKVVHAIGGSSRQMLIRALLYRHHSVWKYYRRFHGSVFTHIPVAIALSCRFVLLSAQVLILRLRAGLVNGGAEDGTPAKTS